MHVPFGSEINLVTHFSLIFRASLEEMRRAAAAQQSAPTKNSTAPASNLVSNAAAIGTSNPPFVNTVWKNKQNVRNDV